MGLCFVGRRGVDACSPGALYGLIGLFGDFIARNADVVTSHPETVEWLSWIVTAIRNVGLAAVVLVWGVVSLLILAVPTLLSVSLGMLAARRRSDRATADDVAAAAALAV